VPTSGLRKRRSAGENRIRKQGEPYLGYVYLIMPWAVSSMAMVK
jgi:hypothetical protein